MLVSETAASPRNQYLFFSLFRDFEKKISGFCILGYRAQRHFQYYTFTTAAGHAVAAAAHSVFGKYMLAVFEMQQCP